MITEHVFGFHGTTKDRAEKIIKDKTWIVGKNAYDWLGHGVYFFQDSPIRALLFAEKRAEQNRQEGKTGMEVIPSVIRARISLENCIDFTDADWAPVLRIARKRLGRIAKSKKEPLPEQEPIKVRKLPRKSNLIRKGTYKGPLRKSALHNLDCAVSNLLLNDINPIFKVFSLRSAFLDGYPCYRTSWLFDLSHVQINVQQPSKVVDDEFEIPLPVVEARRDEANDRTSVFELMK
jgi:hypothetical protein